MPGIRQTGNGVVQTVNGVVQTTPSSSTTSATWQTATDWDSAQSERYVHHEQPASTDWAAADTVELGHDTDGASLQAYFPFDENSGSTATDVSGNSNDGTYNGPTLAAATGILGADTPSFDGTDDYVEYPPIGIDYSGSSDWTTSLWVYLSGGSGSTQNVWHPRATQDMFIDKDTGDAIRFTTYSGSLNRITSTTSIATDQWYHVCVVHDASLSSPYQLYLDGTQEASGSLSDPDSKSSYNSISGQSQGGLDRYYWDGYIDEVRLYDRALSGSEVTTLAQGDSPTGSITTDARNLSSGVPDQLVTTSTLNGGSIDVVVHQDTNTDGTSENSETISLAGGADETNALDGTTFDTTAADYWVDVQPAVSNPDDAAPTIDTAEIVIN